MKNKKFIFITLVISIFILFHNITANAMNTGFSTQSLSSEERKAFDTNVDISFLEIEPNKKTIECFDVNEKGVVAIGSSVSKRKTIAIYDSKGVFQYGYEFDCNGAFGIEWDNDNIIIYFVRSDVACSVNPVGTIEELLKIENTQENNSYWNHSVFSTSRTAGDNKYTIKNDMGLFNVFASSYSQLEIVDLNGEINVFYDVNSYQLSKIIAIFIGVTIFCCMVVCVLIRQFRNTRNRVNKTGE